MSRLQVSIDRLAPRCVVSEPRESMNCKSCRKRKIKCNRMRPSCEACKVFQCPCIYDAIPKKRGPKTDVLEALLKRVDGLEKRLREERSPEDSSISNRQDETSPKSSSYNRNMASSFSIEYSPIDARRQSRTSPQRSELIEGPYDNRQSGSAMDSQRQLPSFQQSTLSQEVLDVFFSKIHDKPFHILDEQNIRQKYKLGQLPACLSMAIFATTLRYTNFAGTSESSLRIGLEQALQARRAVDSDNPTVEGLQTLLLLSQVFFAYGLSKKAYMTLCMTNCSAMIIALGLYQAALSKSNLCSSETQMRKRLFWTCYILDRFAACGSKRPYLISDHSASLSLSLWSPQTSPLLADGEFSSVERSNTQHSLDSCRSDQAAAVLLIDITRILSVANRYLAAGSAKGDPWHSHSTHSKIRQQLDLWAARAHEVFVSPDILFGHPECTTLVLSKLIYHLVHCLIYRPFLPINPLELRGTSQQQSWQIQAAHVCFPHANAIVDLVEYGRNSSAMEWPAFVGYCLCSAGSIHVHGLHYKCDEGDIFATSTEFLDKDMQLLSWLQNFWTGIEHHRGLLQRIHNCHLDLVKALSSRRVQLSPIFHVEDFFDRYPELAADCSYMRLEDLLPSFNNAESAPIRLPDGYGQYLGRPLNTPVLLSQPSPFKDRKRRQLSTLPTPQSDMAVHRRQSTTKITDVMSLLQTANASCQRQPVQQSPQQHSHSPPLFVSSMGLTAYPSAQESPRIQNSYYPSSFGPSFPLEAMLNTDPIPLNPQYATFSLDPGHRQDTSASHSASATPRTTTLTPASQSQSGSNAAISSDNGFPDRESFLNLLDRYAENERNSQGEIESIFRNSIKAERDSLVGLGDGINGSMNGTAAPAGDISTALKQCDLEEGMV